MLLRALLNLLSNAVKATKTGGSIRVRSDSAGGVARVQVSDDGPGIPESDLPRVFDRFFRARNSRDTHDGGGSGLGLTIAARLALRHGGRLTAANNPEGGAVFTLELPLRREVELESQRRRVKPSRRRSVLHPQGH